MNKFSEWFCLKSDRTFMVSPENDPAFYFGRTDLAGEIESRLERGIMLNQVPKLVLYGAFGAGKTHTLHHIKWFLENHADYKFAVRYIETPIDLHKKSKYVVLHQAMMDKIGTSSVRSLLELFITRNLGPDLNETLLDYFSHDEDFVNVVRVLAQGGPQQLTAWNWMRGETLSDAQLQAIGVARNPDLKDLIVILQTIGRLFIQEEQTRLVFLIDELDHLEYVTGEEISTWETAFRKLADQDNRTVGFVMAGRAAGLDEMPSPLQIESVTSRIQIGNYLEIPYIHDVGDFRGFVRDLVSHLVDQDCANEVVASEGLTVDMDYYPFTEEALEVIYQYISEDPTRALPRELLFTLNECGAAAVGSDRLVTEDVAQRALY